MWDFIDSKFNVYFGKEIPKYTAFSAIGRSSSFNHVNIYQNVQEHRNSINFEFEKSLSSKLSPFSMFSMLIFIRKKYYFPVDWKIFFLWLFLNLICLFQSPFYICHKSFSLINTSFLHETRDVAPLYRGSSHPILFHLTLTVPLQPVLFDTFLILTILGDIWNIYKTWTDLLDFRSFHGVVLIYLFFVFSVFGPLL